MKLTSLAAALLLAALPEAALAHGGMYQPPAPPDPPPPPPEPPAPGRPIGHPGKGGPGTGGGGEFGPTTPSGGGGGGPTTPGDGPGIGPPPPSGGGGGGPTTPGSGSGDSGPAPAGRTPTGPTTGGAPAAPTPSRRTSSGVDADHWTRWWYGQRETLLGSDFRARNHRTTTAGNRDAEAAREAMARSDVQKSLAFALADRDEDVSTGAAIALGRGGDPSDAALLLDVLRDRSRQTSVREAAALGLGLIPADTGTDSSTVTRTLVALAAEGKEPERLRAMAVWSLGLRRDAAAVPFLLDTAVDPRADRDVATASVSALGLSGCKLAREDLEAILDGEVRGARRTDVLRRVHAAHALAHLGDRASLPALLAATREDDEDVRRAAILALGSLANGADEEVVQRLVHLLERDRDRACRNVAAISLGRLGGPQAGPALRYAYEKGDSLHQPFAALALGLWARETGDVSVLASVRRDLRERANADLRGALAVALGLAKDRAASRTLRDILEDRGSAELRSFAAAALGMIGDPANAEALRAALEATSDPLLRREAAMALGLLGDVQAVKTLATIVREEDSLFVQGAAALALGRIGGDDTCSVLRDLLRDEKRPGLARAFAAVGLGRLLDRSQGRSLARVGQDLDWYFLTPSAAEILTIL